LVFKAAELLLLLLLTELLRVDPLKLPTNDVKLDGFFVWTGEVSELVLNEGELIKLLVFDLRLLLFNVN